jgi:hypothetical protein
MTRSAAANVARDEKYHDATYRIMIYIECATGNFRVLVLLLAHLPRFFRKP